jgi:glucose-1-phosphate thymidylyltransferase
MMLWFSRDVGRLAVSEKWSLGMKGLVLAGGKGSRLRPFTFTGAKQLVPIANKPVLFYALEQLVQAGIDEIGVVVGETAPQVQAAVGDGSCFGARVTYLFQSAPLGIAHAILVASDFLANDRFVMVLGDNFLREGVSSLVQRFEGSAANCQVVLCPVPNPREFGVALIRDGRLERVVEKPAEPISDLAVTGVYFFDRRVHEAVRSIRPSARGELEISDTIQYLIDAGLRVDHVLHEGYWIDTGRMGDVLAANRAVLELQQGRVDGFVDADSELRGEVVVSAGARVLASRIEGPSIIGAGTVLDNAEVGAFTSIDHDCLVRDSAITGSIVLDNTRIDGVARPIADSLIGRNVVVSGRGVDKPALRLVLGDFSEARLT